MNTIEQKLKQEIEHIFGVQNSEISELKNLEGPNYVYSSIVNKEKYVIK